MAQERKCRGWRLIECISLICITYSFVGLLILDVIWTLFVLVVSANRKPTPMNLCYEKNSIIINSVHSINENNEQIMANNENNISDQI